MSLLVAVIVVLIVVGGVTMGKAANQSTTRELILLASVQVNIRPGLIYGIVMAESSGNPLAKNPDDPSSGLMGVTPLIGRAFGNLVGNDTDVLAQLLIPENNIRAGTRFLAHLSKRYNQLFPEEEWVQAYNLGEPNFDAGERKPEYGRKVERHAANF